MTAKRCLILLASLLGVLGAAVPDDGAAHNRQLLDQWQADPEHRARLERDLRAFHALPPERRERLRRLDRELYALPPAERRHLWRVLERYAAWLERLPEEDRQRLASLDPAERLNRIRALREQQYIERLPAQLRDEVLRLPPEQRSMRVEQLRREERQQRRDWRRTGKRVEAAPPPPAGDQPTRLAELPDEVREFIAVALLPRLTPGEKEALGRAEGRGDYLRTLANFAHRHPVLPPGPNGPVTHYAELPPEAQKLAPRKYLEETDLWKRLNVVEGRWPEFGLTFVGMVPAPLRASLPPLGASRPQEFTPEVREVLAELRQESPADADRLHKVEGRWPEYPRLLLDLAHKHRLHIPGMNPPGPRDWWEHRNAG